MGEPQICFSCGVADSIEIWHAGLSASLRAESMPVFNTKNLLFCMSVVVSTCIADWLRFGVGEWSIDPVPQSWVWLARASHLPFILSSCDLGSTNPLTCASLPVLSFQLVALPEGNKKSFPD